MRIDGSTTPYRIAPGMTTRTPDVRAASDPRTHARAPERIDFSSITPRQLHAYLDEMVMSGRMDLDDGGVLFGSIPAEWYDERPDVPIDLNANIKGMADFAQDNGYDALAAFYRALMERMKSMEACSVPLSVIA